MWMYCIAFAVPGFYIDIRISINLFQLVILCLWHSVTAVEVERRNFTIWRVIEDLVKKAAEEKSISIP